MIKLIVSLIVVLVFISGCITANPTGATTSSGTGSSPSDSIVVGVSSDLNIPIKTSFLGYKNVRLESTNPDFRIEESTPINIGSFLSSEQKTITAKVLTLKYKPTYNIQIVHDDESSIPFSVPITRQAKIEEFQENFDMDSESSKQFIFKVTVDDEFNRQDNKFQLKFKTDVEDFDIVLDGKQSPLNSEQIYEFEQEESLPTKTIGNLFFKVSKKTGDRAADVGVILEIYLDGDWYQVDKKNTHVNIEGSKPS